MESRYSIIIPVYNRAEELRELLRSFEGQTFHSPYEIIVVDDGSEPPFKPSLVAFEERLPVSYYYKANTGPGDSRNFGVQRARGKYVVFMDSDCVLPPDYLQKLDAFVRQHQPDCFGGRDMARKDFTDFQKAVDYTMTSFFTTGGIRGGAISDKKFEPRSFNMGVSRSVFEKIGGFARLHPGEDPDISLRLRAGKYRIKQAKALFVYHRRRVSWKSFARQIYKFGTARAILNRWHPNSRRLAYWFPTAFSLTLIAGLLVLPFSSLIVEAFCLYALLLFTDGLLRTKSFKVSLLSLAVASVQFFSYGYGFLKGTALLAVGKSAEQALSYMFFQTTPPSKA